MNIQTIESIESLKGLVIIPFLEQEEGITPPSQYPQLRISKSLFSGKKDQIHFVEEAEHQRIFMLLGLGKEPNFMTVKNTFRKVSSKFAELLQNEVLVMDNGVIGKDGLEAAVMGLVLGTYRLGHFKKEEKPAVDWNKVHLRFSTSIGHAEHIISKALKIAHAQKETLHMVDLPPDRITPEFLADWAKQTGKEYGFDVQVFGRHKAEKEGLHAFLAVGRGSQKEPQFIILQYRPERASKHLGLVGKGVTFDTGGMNIKTQSMELMKSDMAGAAAVLGAFRLIADLELEIKLTAVIPCVENAVDNTSLLPSEVIQSYSGKSIEIIDTDAEGRLILADALSYLIKNHNPDHVVDLATLTGSSIGTFGYHCAAMFTKDEELSRSLSVIGHQIGEKVWGLPLWEEYQSEMDSEIADIKNYHGKPYAGAITAAKFLEFFTEKHPSWVHLDIAGPSFGNSEFFKTQHATAYGVHLLARLAEEMLTK